MRAFGITALLALVVGCDQSTDGGVPPNQAPATRPMVVPPQVPQAIVEAANRLDAGETRDAVIAKLGQPQYDEVMCSKDLACERKFVSLKYCFPKKDSCTNLIELLLNEQGRLFELHSNIREIPARTFPEHQPKWLTSAPSN